MSRNFYSFFCGTHPEKKAFILSITKCQFIFSLAQSKTSPGQYVESSPIFFFKIDPTHHAIFAYKLYHAIVLYEIR